MYCFNHYMSGLFTICSLLSLGFTGGIYLNKDFRQMQWGRAFANLCYKHKVKLVNYPVGLKPIGPQGGISGSTLIPLKYVKAIVKPHVWFWQQEAREKKAKAAKMKEAQSLFKEDSPEEEEDQEQM